MTYYIGILIENKMRIEILTGAPNADKAIQNIIERFPYGIITFIYKE